MSEARRDLWPDAVDVTAITPPIVILREQAALLGEKTKGLVRGEIESRTEPLEKEEFEDYLGAALSPKELLGHVHTLYLLAPALDNYQYALLSVKHDFQAYPCYADYHPDQDFSHYVENEEALLSWLGLVLSKPPTVRIIHALISRVQALGATQAQEWSRFA